MAKKTPSAATLKWRKNNPEKYKQYMRNYMKKKRAEKEDPNALAREALKARVKTAKPAPAVTNPPPASVFSLMKSKLPTKDTRGPVQVKPKTQPAKGKEGA